MAFGPPSLASRGDRRTNNETLKRREIQQQQQQQQQQQPQQQQQQQRHSKEEKSFSQTKTNRVWLVTNTSNKHRRKKWGITLTPTTTVQLR